MSTTREYKDGGQAAPQWKPAVVWGANHAHGPEVADHKDDAEAYNLHGSPEKGECMLLADQLGYLGRGRWSSGTFPVRWQCTQTWLWWHNAGICCAAEPQPTDDWVLQCADHTLTEPFLVSAPLLKSYEKKSVGKLSQFWLAIWILRTVGNKPQLLESTLPVFTPVHGVSYTGQPMDLAPAFTTGQHSTASPAAIFFNRVALKFIPNHYR